MLSKGDANGKWQEGAWQALFDSNYNRVFRTALRIVADKGLAEDVVQEAFVKAFLEIDALTDKSKFSAWVCSIAENAAKNALKKELSGKGKTISLETMDAKMPEEVISLGEKDNPEIMYGEIEAAEEILSCIEALDSEGRRILHLKYYEGLSFAEIAKQMNIKEGTVRMKALRARDKIYKELSGREKKGGQSG